MYIHTSYIRWNFVFYYVSFVDKQRSIKYSNGKIKSLFLSSLRKTVVIEGRVLEKNWSLRKVFKHMLFFLYIWFNHILKNKEKSFRIEKFICSYELLSDVQKIMYELGKANLITER